MNNDKRTTYDEDARAAAELAELNATVQTIDVNPFAERAAAEAAKPKKASVFSLVTRQRKRRPFFGVLYGPPGVGKSTFASEAPNPIFIPCERGLDQITVDKLPIPKDLNEFGTYLKAIEEEEEFKGSKTVVIDTIDGLELLIFEAVCKEGNVQSIEEYGGGWQKGYVRAREYWARLLTRLTRMSEKRTVLLLSHSHLRSVNDPMLGTAYDVFEMKIQQKSVELIRQAVDLILFARLATTVAKDAPKAKKGRGLVSGDREMYTQPTTGLESKNRFGLESPMEFTFEALQAGIDKFYS
jgi:AAA domain